MKAVLEFTLPDEKEEFDDASNGSIYKGFIDDIGSHIFRPARKHGYSEPQISQLVERLDALAGEDKGATELIGLLEELFYRLKDEALHN